MGNVIAARDNIKSNGPSSKRIFSQSSFSQLGNSGNSAFLSKVKFN